jgi:hypothetical protein
MRAVKIHLVAGHGSVEVDGEALKGVTGVALSHRVGTIAQLEVSLAALPLDIEAEADVFVPDKTRESLILLGWTPPSDDGVPVLACGITHTDIDAFLEQVKRDRSASYWSEGPHADTLDHVETWLLSLSDWLPDDDGA